MQIYAHDGGFSVGLGGGFLYAWDKKDKSLVLKEDPKATYKFPVVTVQTGHGDFIEAIDEKGEVVTEGGGGEWCPVPIGKKPIRLRFKKLPKPELTKAQMEKARRKVTRHLYSDSPYSLGLNGTLKAAIATLEKKRSEVPKAYRDSAEINFRNRSSYGESYENVEITWEEPETDDELIERLTVDAEHERRKTDQEKAQFKKLRAKFCVP